jgi:outer membrane protein assembly factor BamB
MITPGLAMAMALALIGSRTEDARSADWPQWRGPQRDAISTETGLLKEWPTGGPKLLWKTEGLGVGYSSVAIAGGKLYTMGDRGESCYLIALDLATRKELWAAKVGDSRGGGGYEGPRCTPTVDGDLVFALGQHGDLVCVETATGKEVWRKNYSKDYGGKKDGNWGCSESPLVDGDKLVCTPGGRSATMVAFDKRTGEELWKAAVPGNPGAGHSSIVIAEVGGVRQYVNLTAGGVIGISARDGKFLWKYGEGKIAPNTANIPTCIVQGELVFCTAGYGKGGALLKLVADDQGGIKAQEQFFKSELNNKHGGVVLVNGHVYGDTDDRGTPFCADFKTGEVVWKRERSRTGSGGSGSAAIVYADGLLYLRYQNAVMVIARATPEGYKEAGFFKIPRKGGGASWPHPVILDGKLYLREQDELFCYDIKAS